MVKSQNGPRSNFSLLPFEVQYRMISLLQDGATFSTLAADREISEAYRKCGLKLAPPAISRLKKSEQYREWSGQRLKERSNFTADRLTTAFLRENATLDTIAEQTRVALLKVVRQAVDGTNDVKEVERLVRSAATLSNAAKDRKISDLTSENAALKAENAALKSAHSEEIQRLTDHLNGLRSQLAKLGMEQIGNVADEMDKRVGL